MRTGGLEQGVSIEAARLNMSAPESKPTLESLRQAQSESKKSLARIKRKKLFQSIPL